MHGLKPEDIKAWKRHKGIALIVLAILIWINDKYSVLTWWSFVGLIAALAGIKMLILSKYCYVKKKKK